jgi:hypothetical protein
MLICDAAQADSAALRRAPTRAYAGHSVRAARLLCALDLAFRVAASVRLYLEPDDQWARNRNRRPSAAMPFTPHLI